MSLDGGQPPGTAASSVICGQGVGFLALEEMYLWPAVREHLSAGDTLADTATEQEQAAKQVLTELDKLGGGLTGGLSGHC